jgi:hypothetical protein
MVHPTPKNESENLLFNAIAKDTLKRPDTWESRMAGGENKKDVFTDLLKRKKLGYLALLRNLRGMLDAGVDIDLIRDGILNGNMSRILPFRFIAAARHAPRLEKELDMAMISALNGVEKMSGRTIALIDVSYSMEHQLSQGRDGRPAEMTRLDAACGLSILLKGVCEDIRIFTFSNYLVEIPARSGMALADAINRSQSHQGTKLGAAVKHMNSLEYDRLIVFTDEQSQDPVGSPKAGRAGYMINVASYQNGVGYGDWLRITGFSEYVVNYIRQLEKEFGR